MVRSGFRASSENCGPLTPPDLHGRTGEGERNMDQDLRPPRLGISWRDWLIIVLSLAFFGAIYWPALHWLWSEL